jgi:hypothetical protein
VLREVAPVVIASGDERLCGDANRGVWLQLSSAHPENAAVHFQNRPGGTVLTGNFHSLKHFLNLAETRGVAKMNSIAGLPRAQNGPSAGFAGIPER